MGLLLVLSVPAVRVISALLGGPDYRLHDDGTIVYTALRASLGEYPHIAFPYHYAGGWEMALAQLFRAFGSSLGLAQWALGCTMAISGVALYLILVRLKVDQTIAVCLAVFGSLAAFALHFHLLPAWPSQTAVLWGTVLLFIGLRRSSSVSILAAGFCVGLAISMKQNSGIYAGLAFVLYSVLWFLQLTPTSGDGSTPRGFKRWVLVAAAWLTVLVMLLIPALLLFIIRVHLTLLNSAMFLLLPGIITILIVRDFMRVCLGSVTRCVSMMRRLWSTYFLLGSGVFFGFLPLLLFYISQHGAGPFISESFLQAQTVGVARFAGFTNEVLFASVDACLIYVVPLAAASFMFGAAYSWWRRYDGNGPSQLLLLVSLVVAFGYFTLYPNPFWVYINYLATLMLVPVAMAVDRHLKHKISRSIVRSAVVMAVIGLVGLAGVLTLAATHRSWGTMQGHIQWLDDPRGQTYVRKSWAEYLAPVLAYLRTRPDSERFIAYDLHNRTIAFLTGRRIEMDFGQRLHLGGADKTDYVEILTQINGRGISIVILSKRSLQESPELNDLLDRLRKDYVLVLNNENHLIFQKSDASDSS